MSETPLEISCHDVQARQLNDPTFRLIDCREPEEYATAKIPGAVLIPMSEFADRVEELADLKSVPFAVHCHHGGRSMRVVRWLRNQGYAHAMNMAGGIEEWSLQVDPSVPRY